MLINSTNSLRGIQEETSLRPSCSQMSSEISDSDSLDEFTNQDQAVTLPVFGQQITCSSVFEHRPSITKGTGGKFQNEMLLTTEASL